METQATMASISSTQLYDHDNKQEQANKNNTKHWSKGPTRNKCNKQEEQQRKTRPGQKQTKEGTLTDRKMQQDHTKNDKISEHGHNNKKTKQTDTSKGIKRCENGQRAKQTRARRKNWSKSTRARTTTRPSPRTTTPK